MISHDDEIAIRRLGGAWEAAWNEHDMRALASLVTPGVDFITVMGSWLGTQNVFEQHHAKMHATQFKASVWRTRGMAIRPLAAEICVVHVNWSMSGDTNRDGTPRQPRDGIFTWVVRRDRSLWLIDASHNTNVVPEIVGPEQRKPTP